MQTGKSRNGSLDTPQKKSPATPRTARQLKSGGSASDSPSPNQANRNLKTRSPKPAEKASPRTPISEKKRTSKMSELESQLAQLQEELRRSKEQLSSFDSQKKRAQQEAEETRRQISSLSVKLEESEQQLVEISDSEDARLQELRKISHERDRAWQSELEALQKQHAMDTNALGSAMSEVQRLKKQLEIVAESEAKKGRHAESAHAEIHSLRTELSETLELVEQMKHQLADSKESESRAFEVANETQMELEETKATAEAIRSDSLKAMEGYKKLASDLEQSRAQVGALESLVTQLQADSASSGTKDEEKDNRRAEIDSLRIEAEKLKSALEASEARYQEEYIQSTLQIRTAYDEMERVKTESRIKEAELEEELRKVKDTLEKLESDVVSKQNTVENNKHENQELTMRIHESQVSSAAESQLMGELKKLEDDVAHLKSALAEKETRMKTLAEENEILRMNISDRDMEKSWVNEEAERETLMKLGSLTEEADKSSKKAAKITEQLDAAQAVNSELEAELRRLKVQADQWRKAAEAAAAMLTPGGDAKLVDKSPSLDSGYNAIAMKMESPFSEYMDDDSAKKKNANMLKKIGGLWKKGQK